MLIERHYLESLYLPLSFRTRLAVAKYMEYKQGETDFVMQSHIIGRSQHMDFRFKVDGFLEGWSIVGGNIDDPITPKKFLDNIGKGFRAEEKCYSLYCNEWRYRLVETDTGYKFEPLELDDLTEDELENFRYESFARQPCVSIDTKVIKNQSLVDAGEIKVGDLVYTLEGFQEVRRVDRVFKPEQYRIKLSLCPFELQVDGDHPFLVNDVYYGDWSKISRQHRRYIKETCKPVWIQARNMEKGMILLFPRPKERYYLYSREVGRVLGFFLGDGNLTGTQVRLYFNAKKELEKLEFYFKLLTFLGFKVKRYRRKDNVLYLSFGIAKHYLRNEFERLKKKEIPVEYIEANKEFQIGLLEGLIDSDGYIDSRGFKHLINSSFSILNGVVMILAKLGYFPFFRVRRNWNYQHTKKISLIGELIWKESSRKKSYLVYPDYIGLKIKRIERADPKELVNIVTDSHTFCLPYVATHNTVWLLPKLKVGESIDIPPGKVGAGEDAPGRFTILTRGKLIIGTQKPHFHEYWLKDGRYFKDWTRVVLQATKVKKIDPKTKQPIEGQYEMMWRFMIPKDQMPYTISTRARSKKWKPPLLPKDQRDKEEKDPEKYVLKNYYIPFPLDWVKKKYPKEYKEWINYMTGEKLSKIKWTLALVTWMGARAKTGRRMPRFNWYFFIDDGGSKVRCFRLEGYPLGDDVLVGYYLGKYSRKWMTYEGKLKPQSLFNPNKKLVADYSIIATGSGSLEEDTQDGFRVLRIKIPSTKMKGTWEFREQESELWDVVRLSLAEEERVYKFVLDEHEFPIDSGKVHWDIRIQEDDHIFEFNLADNPLDLSTGEKTRAVLKYCYDLEWMKIKKNRKMKAFGVWSRVNTLDHGDVVIIEQNPEFMSFEFRGKKLKGVYVLKRDKIWYFSKATLVGQSSTGDPRSGDYFDPFLIEEKRTWDYFIVHIYDLRDFTRVEPFSKVEKYLPDLEIPEGVKIGIGLYPVPGKLHHARVAYVIFSKDLWDYDRAREWIKRNKLHTWSGVQIREKRK